MKKQHFSECKHLKGRSGYAPSLSNSVFVTCLDCIKIQMKKGIYSKSEVAIKHFAGLYHDIKYGPIF